MTYCAPVTDPRTGTRYYVAAYARGRRVAMTNRPADAKAYASEVAAAAEAAEVATALKWSEGRPEVLA